MLNKLKEHITRNRLIGAGVVLLLIIIISNCGGAVRTVKKGRLKLDGSITVSQALENYPLFKKTSWKSFSDQQGRKIVEFIGEIDMNEMCSFEVDGVIYNPLEEETMFKDILDHLLGDAIYNSSGKNTITGDWEALNEMYLGSTNFRNGYTLDLIERYESEPDYVVQKAKEILTEWGEWNTISPGHEEMLQYMVDREFEKAMEVFRRESPDLVTNLKNNSGYYRCQFAVVGKEFSYVYGERSYTVDVKGSTGPITFTVPERDYMYLKTIYANENILGLISL